MDNWLANIVGDVDSLYVEIDNLNNPLVGFCFIKSIDSHGALAFCLVLTPLSPRCHVLFGDLCLTINLTNKI
jgi:hypothetical protein